MYEKPDLTEAVKLRPATIDDFSSIRYVHATSFRILASEHHSESEIKAHVDMIYRPEYGDSILSTDLTVATIDNEIVGTAGWAPADDNGSTARIRKVFVRPLFTGTGIGKLLLNTAEDRAKRAGFEDFSVRANINAVSFYENRGYDITSYGVMPTQIKVDLPVAFMRKKEIIKPTVNVSKHTETTGSPISREGWWSSSQAR